MMFEIQIGGDVIKEAIESAFEEDVEVQILDPREDGVHLEAIVVSDTFEGMGLLEGHRKVMSPLTEQFATSLHALALKTYTKKEYEHARKN